MKEIKIKICGILPLTKKQFIIGFSFFFIFFVVTIISFYFFPPQKSPEEASFLSKLFKDYGLLTFFFFLIWLIAEGIFYCNRFIKVQYKLIEEQKHEVDIRNQYIEQHKKEIITQRVKIETQHNLVIAQMTTISNQKKELLDSIQYAYRIQCALLPPFYYVNQCIPDCFILYLPKAIVSGDFYFVEQSGDYTIVAAVDCTGHGVPGAMMSVIGYDLLNQAVKINKITKPSDILSFLDAGVTDILRQTHNESGVKDGMDLSVVSIDRRMRTFEYAGAYNSIYFIHNKQLTEVKSDKLQIGVNEDGITDVFTNNGLPVVKGDMLYLFSDGYADQFGGPKGKKLKYKQFQTILTEISGETVENQKQLINQKFMDWKGEQEQVDDILVIGIRV
ncbi:MAG: hypothetical protein COX07_07415 [Bacteroidetes bacterium CG23_combo_of_CG06-09_8_20_14_all_32_9]|nr:MAG: hypothetical protein COX07_07415 [Bacteroidetes bacterium CG23_combo_of_CG06-09_8_20_14_all_32_9]